MNDALPTASTLPPPSTERRLANADYALRDALAQLDAIRAAALTVEQGLLAMRSVETDAAVRGELAEYARALATARGGR